jgi:predicted phosphate transport protein (TIGR00153 family)
MSKPERYRSSLADALPDSPYKMLMAHYGKVILAVEKLEEMLNLYLKEEYSEAATISVEISKLEHEADEVKRHMRTTLPRMILMPISRQETLDILTSVERIADSAQDVAQILDMRQTNVPDEICPLVLRFVGHVIDSVRALGDMMGHMNRLLESSFAKVETREIIELGQHVHEHEYKADCVNKQLSKKIYALEGRESPLAIVHMMRFLDVLDGVADNAENAALKIVLVVSK